MYQYIIRDLFWKTVVSRGYAISTITRDTVMTNGKHYFVFNWRPDSDFGNIVRTDSNQIFFYRDGKEYSVFRFDSASGANWTTPAGDMTYDWSGSEELFGDSTQVAGFRKGGITYANYRFSDRFGPTRFEDYQDMGGFLPVSQYDLVGCVLNGQTYGTISSADDNERNSLPRKFTLHQNYPNPFNPTTTISYDLPVRSRITLKVFNVLGQEVATLVNGEVEAGRHQVLWNAAGVPSGVYVCRMNAGHFVETKKMILVR